MTSRELFIQEIETFINKSDIILSEAAMLYFESLKNVPSKEPKLITENGVKILKYAQENKDTYNNIFTARSMGDGIGIGSKVVSGAMRKLVTDGFFEKVGANPVSYSITEKGMNFSEFDN